MRARALHLGSVVGIAAVVLAGCARVEPQHFAGPTMGSTYAITYVGEAESAKLQRGVEAILAEVDRTVSTYRNDSDVAVFNAAPAGHCQTMSESVLTMLRQAQQVHTASAGALDVGLLPAVRAWGFAGTWQKGDFHPPTAQDLQRLRGEVGMRYVQIQDNLQDKNALPQLCKTAPVEIEFNSVAAGYAVDRVRQYLLDAGIQSFLINITGELAAHGKKPDGSSWRVGIEAPVEAGRVAQRIVALENMAVSTSGDYRNYFERNGERYSHILDPRTLEPVRHRLASVTVVHESAMAADAWSTALMVMGPQQGWDFAQKNGLAAFFIVKKSAEEKTEKALESDFELLSTSAFEEKFTAQE